MLAKIIGMKLEEEGFKVDHAYDGEEAYQILSKKDLPDLVLLDVLLPKMSGFDVLEKLKQEGATLPKVIVFSNFAQKADVERAHDLGAVDYIVKAAFSPAEILGKIKALFNESDAKLDEGHMSGGKKDGDKQDSQEKTSAYDSFESMQEVKPMSEVLHPGESSNNR